MNSLGINRSQAIELLVVVVIVLIYCWGTYQRNLVWKTGFSLWTDVLEKSHAKARPHCNLGRSYLRNKAYARAMPCLKEALRIRPDFMEAHYNLGIAYQGLGLYDKAIAEYENILHKRQHVGASNDSMTFNKPYFAKFHNNLGVCYFRKGWKEKAIWEFEQAIRIDPPLFRCPT